MNGGMKKIIPLDSAGKERFFGPAGRLIEAQRKQYRAYHEHPIQRDMIAEHDAIAAWGTVTCCYSGIEQAMKCLLQMRGAYIDKPQSKGGHRHHNIGKLFQDLASEEKDILSVSYAIYRSLHDYIPPETVDSFLQAIDDGYPTWRYFLLEGQMPPTTHPGAMLEIWSALSDLLRARIFTNHGLNSVENRIKHNLYHLGLQKAWTKHGNTDIGQREIDDMNRWMKRYDSVPLNAYAHLIYHQAESTLDEIEVLPSTREVLRTMVDIIKEKWVDNDFAHFLRRAQTEEIAWNPDKNRFETVSRPDKIRIKWIEPKNNGMRDYIENSILDPSIECGFVDSAPAYIEDFIFEPRVKAEQVGEDWSIEDESRRAREEIKKRQAEISEYKGGNECEGYKCHINGTELIIILYDSKEWIVYRYYNDSVPGLPFHCEEVGEQFRSIREAFKAIEHWRRTEKKEFEACRKHLWNRRGKRKTEDTVP